MLVLGFLADLGFLPARGARSGDEGRKAAGLRPWRRQAHARQGGLQVERKRWLGDGEV